MRVNICWLLVLIILCSPLALAIQDDCIYYFYGKDCDSCKALDSYFLDLSQKYPQVKIELFEVYHDLDNYNLIQKYFQAYQINERSQQIPVVFTADSYFIGQKSITSLLEEKIKSNEDPSCPSLGSSEMVGVLGTGEPYNVFDTLTIFQITGDAVRNVFQPGIIAVVLLLLALISLLKDKKTIVKKGFLFVSAIYLTYLLFSLGLFTALYHAGIYGIFYKIIGGIAVLCGIIGLISFGGTWNRLIKKAPEQSKKYLHTFVHFMLSSWSMFLLGLVTSLLTFASVGDTFLLMRSLYMGDFMRTTVLPLILYYILILVLPVAALILLFKFIRYSLDDYVVKYKKISDKTEEQWKKHYNKVLNFFVYLVLLILGVLLLFI